MIRVDNLVKRFGPTLAVAGISFEVGQGEVVGFLGPNGAGKTTTLRVLTCFHPATSGRATVAGHEVFEEPVAVRRAVGYLPENVPVYPDLRVDEYLSYRAALKGVPYVERRRRVEEAMDRTGVVEVRRKLVGHVSRGYRQRVGLADALVAKPPILILDEPTSGLDPNQRIRIKRLVRELAEHHTILFSSHILAEVQDVSDRILIIHDGHLVADGTPSGLLAESAGRTLVVTAALDPGVLAELVTGIDGVSAPRATAVAGGFTTIEAPVVPEADPRDAVSAALRARDAAIRELSLRLPTLEDVFSSLTGGEGVVDAAAGAVGAAGVAAGGAEARR